MGKTSKVKGDRGEAELARLLRPFFPDAYRSSGAQRRKTGSYGKKPPDLEALPFWPEVQRAKKGGVRIRSKLEQAQRETDGRLPIAFTREDRDVWVVSMTLDAFLVLLAPRIEGVGWLWPTAGDAARWVADFVSGAHRADSEQ